MNVLLVSCDLRYPGQLYDAESGLYYNRYRYYDPELGQYLSSDPIGLAGGIRPQGYVHKHYDIPHTEINYYSTIFCC